MFQVTGLNILGRVGSFIFLVIFFLEKHNYMHWKGILPFKMHKIYFFRKPEKILGPTSQFRYGRVTLNIGILYLMSFSDTTHILYVYCVPDYRNQMHLKFNLTEVDSSSHHSSTYRDLTLGYYTCFMLN